MSLNTAASKNGQNDRLTNVSVCVLTLQRHNAPKGMKVVLWHHLLLAFRPKYPQAWQNV